MTSAPLLPTVEELQADPASSYWLKFALQAALGRDPVDAANESELLAAVLAARARRLLMSNRQSQAEFSNDQLMPRSFDADELAALALDVGLLRRGEPLPCGLLELVAIVVERCASLGDRYSDLDGTAGDEIRARFGLGPTSPPSLSGLQMRSATTPPSRHNS